MSENLLEEVFRNIFGETEPEPTYRRVNRERLNARQTTNGEERAEDARRDLEDTFGIYEDPWNYTREVL